MNKELQNKIELLLLEKRRYGLEQKVSLIEKWKLRKNVPIQKIIGYIEMANVKIYIRKKVLIPRYETEELIYIAFDLIRKNKINNVLDLGCGSGFIGIALKKQFPNLNIIQSDIDNKAIKQTRYNLKVNNISNKVIKSNIFENINDIKFDLIVSNPPYLANDEKEIMSKSVLKHEPHHALFAKDNGLFFYMEIENNIKDKLNDGGWVIFEINPLNVEWFKKRDYKVIKDINGKERFAFKQFNQF